MEIYLDNSATTRPYDEVAQRMMEYLTDKYANPSSAHSKGVEIERDIKNARKKIASLMGAGEDEIFFTSGGTEADNVAIRGVAYANRKQGRHIITTSIEHPAVLSTVRDLESEGFEATYLSVDSNGVIDFEEFKKALRDETILVAIMHVNNECGSIQPVDKIGRYLSKLKRKVYFFVDAVQSFGKIDFRPSRYGIDLMSISGHKLHGPKGIGALYVKKGTKPRPIVTGGGQEKGIRPGTENVPGIMGLETAAEKTLSDLGSRIERLASMKRLLQEELEARVPNIKVNSMPEGVCHILNISFMDVKGEVLLHTLEQDGIFVSTGSACSSKKKGSHVLGEMGLSNAQIEGAIRFSLGEFNTVDQIKSAAETVSIRVEEFRKIVGK